MSGKKEGEGRGCTVQVLSGESGEDIGSSAESTVVVEMSTGRRRQKGKNFIGLGQEEVDQPLTTRTKPV